MSSPLGLKEKFSTCIHENKKTRRPKRRYERFDSILLPLPLYEGEIRKGARKSDRQLKELLKEKHIPTSYLEEIEKRIPKKEYYSTGIPSVYSYTTGKGKQIEVKVIKGSVLCC